MGHGPPGVTIKWLQLKGIDPSEFDPQILLMLAVVTGLALRVFHCLQQLGEALQGQ